MATSAVRSARTWTTRCSAVSASRTRSGPAAGGGATAGWARGGRRRSDGGLVVAALADEALQARDEGGGVDLLAVAGLDRVHGGAEGVQALEDDVDGLAMQAAGALAQQLEDVLHLVGDGGDALEAHRRAHPLE